MDNAENLLTVKSRQLAELEADRELFSETLENDKISMAELANRDVLSVAEFDRLEEAQGGVANLPADIEQLSSEIKQLRLEINQLRTEGEQAILVDVTLINNSI